MPRSADEKRRRATKYGRRHRVLRAQESAVELEAVVAALLKELGRSGVSKADRRRLVNDLKRTRDHTRRRRAIWAIIDALETAEAI